MSYIDDLPTAGERAVAAARKRMLQVIEQLSIGQLAKLARHSYDDEGLRVPEFCAAGQDFLFAGRDAFTAWVRREGRFPGPAEADDAATTWHRTEATGGQVAEAFVGLALYRSAHAADAPGADVAGLHVVLDRVADTVAFNLTMEYGPLH